MKLIITLILSLFIHVAYAQDTNSEAPDHGELEGKYMLDSINFYDPGPEPRNTHFYIKITGKPAQKLYDNITASSTVTKRCFFGGDECVVMEHKKSGQVNCKRELIGDQPRKAKCFITVNLKGNIIIDGVDIDEGDL